MLAQQILLTSGRTNRTVIDTIRRVWRSHLHLRVNIVLIDHHHSCFLHLLRYVRISFLILNAFWGWLMKLLLGNTIDPQSQSLNRSTVLILNVFDTLIKLLEKLLFLFTLLLNNLAPLQK